MCSPLYEFFEQSESFKLQHGDRFSGCKRNGMSGIGYDAHFQSVSVLLLKQHVSGSRQRLVHLTDVCFISSMRNSGAVLSPTTTCCSTSQYTYSMCTPFGAKFSGNFAHFIPVVRADSRGNSSFDAIERLKEIVKGVSLVKSLGFWRT